MQSIVQRIASLKRDLARGGCRPNQVAEIEDEIERLQGMIQPAPDGVTLFTDQHKGRKCYIFGTGPSLNRFDCDKMAADGVTICCNASIMALSSCDYFMFTDPRVPDDPYYPSVFGKAGTVVIGNEDLYAQCIGEIPPEVRDRVVVPSPRRRTAGGGVDFSLFVGAGDQDNDCLIAGESVVEVAAHFAYTIGCSPLILVGVDLCWTNGQKYFHDRSDTLLWASLGKEDEEETDESLARCFQCWTQIKAANPDLQVFIANEESRLCALYPSVDLSEFHK